VTQHASLSAERWAAFSLDQQILMIANEMNRAAGLAREDDRGRLKNSYERVLQLVDLTVRCHTRRALLKELLRWRDLVAELYLFDPPRPDAHRALLRCLLLFTPTASQQIPHVLPSSRAPAAAPVAPDPGA
jgi:hypothetical protein